ncbi:hypothetical protein PGQ11_010751 [Apiospora arundinis]|uniref:F-box domain-containing protein n=1 Tax=Apiospora arundinis TaxID=335852 RepID=A0ABR2IB49_9PEZI
MGKRPLLGYCGLTKIRMPLMAAICYLDRLPDEILQEILDFAMTRDFLLFIDHLFPEPLIGLTSNPQTMLAASRSRTETRRCSPGRADYRRDWIAISSASRRIRRLGRESFFRVKVLALATSDLRNTEANTTTLTTAPTTLPPPNFALFGGDPLKKPPALMLTREQRQEQPQKEQPQEQTQHRDLRREADKTWDGVALVLPRIQHAVLMNSNHFTPNWYLRLPAMLARVLPLLRRCTLLYYFKGVIKLENQGRNQNHEAMEVRVARAAFQLARSAPSEMRTLMRGIGMPPDVVMEETLIDRPKHTWEMHHESMEKYIYPILRIRARAKARMAKELETNHCN